MEYFISDLHFGHKNAIWFDRRPFDSCEEMDNEIISRINEKVSDSDHLYILGDISMKPAIAIDRIKKVSGIKHLILGNHDNEKAIRESGLFEEICDYKKIEIKNEALKEFKDNGTIIVCLSHFPMICWDKQLHGSVHIYGHLHNNGCVYFDEYGRMKKFPMNKMRNAYNVFCGYQNYYPMSLYEIMKKYGYSINAYKETMR